MSNPISVGLSPITNTIFAGRSKEHKGLVEGARKWVGERFDVTDDACHAVAMHLMKAGETVVYDLPDGKELHLKVDIKEAK